MDYTQELRQEVVLTDDGQVGLESGGVLYVLQCASCKVPCQIVDGDGTV